ncbi:LAFA_0E20230g1_1 [Lachancea sp. 'fantastica']|nr:LAFA_0E20230g1_1 [Lachancea sp. 'fantastica']
MQAVRRGLATQRRFLLRGPVITTMQWRMPLHRTLASKSNDTSSPGVAATGGPGSTNGQVVPAEVLSLSMDVYHTRSDLFLESLQDQLEILSDDHPQLMPDIELTQGVMTVVVPSVGTYVLNKQPPNKQIWLSSPVSGPNRFDLFRDRWVSLRDGQDLLQVLNQELSQVFPEPVNLELDE